MFKIKKYLIHLLKLYRNLTIRGKLVLIMYILIIVPMIFIGYMSFKNSEEIIKEKSIDYSQDILHLMELRLSDYINNLSVISQDLLYDKNIYDILNEGGLMTDPLRNYERENEINNTLKKIVLSRNEIQSICFVTNKAVYYYADNNSKNTSIRNILPYEKVLESARKGNGKVVWYLDCNGRKVENIFLVRTVYNRDNFREIGLLAILVKKEFLETVYQGLTGNMQNIAVLSSDNSLIVSRNPDFRYVLDEGLFKNFSANKNVVISKEQNLLISYTTLNEPGWRIVTYVSLQELYRDADILRQRIILLCLFSTVILSILSTLIAIDFMNPINELVNAMKKVQSGESGVYINDDRGDELGFLNKTFNEMAKEINHLVNWVYREQITRKEAEIKALQSQINPHFLFNTLESINWMAQLNNVPEISDTVNDLSSIMEVSIGRDDRLISVEEEFAYADKYISLLKKRFEDRICLIKNVQRDTLDIKIPRLLIQPLIENAVYHGIEKSRNKGIIELNSRIEDNTLIIEVIDNGLGIEKDELVELNERLSLDNDTYFKALGTKRKKSIGIENVNRRVKLFYGESFGVSIESEPGSHTKVIIRIPLNHAEVKEGFHVQGIDYR